MSRSALSGAVIALAVVAGLVFAGVAVHELNYASNHAHAYGPAKIIAWAGAGGVILCVSVGLLGVGLMRADEQGTST